MNNIKAKQGHNEVVVKAGDSYNITFDVEDTSKEAIQHLNDKLDQMHEILHNAVVQILLYEDAIFTLTGTKQRGD